MKKYIFTINDKIDYFKIDDESLFIILIMLLSIANIKICTDAIMKLNDNTEKTVAQNKKAYHDYFVEESLEAEKALIREWYFPERTQVKEKHYEGR